MILRRIHVFWLFLGIALVPAFFCVPLIGQEDDKGERVTFVHSKENQSVDIFIDGNYFSSYRYEQTWKKPVLYPIHTISGISLTRGYPIDPKPGERYDHPHHVGFWLNYGDVNGLDFWNNSNTRSPDKKDRYGEVVHHNIYAMESDGSAGRFKVGCHWINAKKELLVEETTIFSIEVKDTTIVLDRFTELTAVQDLVFKDNKEGMVAVRVARELELPSDDPIKILDENLKPAKEAMLDTMYRNGDYLSSEGVRGKSVWGTRAGWMQLMGTIMEKPVSLVLIDHPDNVGYPTYWHARAYGLFSANPLGQKIFSKGKNELNFTLDQGQSVVFKYRLLIHEGAPLTSDQINARQKEFSRSY